LKKKPAPSDVPSPSGTFGEKAFLVSACFLAGAGIMVVELAGNRLITPLFGNTMFTWTGLIGVVLVAIAAGDYLGGWLVDRHPDFRTLGFLFFGAAVATVLVYPFFILCRPWIAGWSPVSGPIIASVLLFSAPAFLLASVSPFIVRLLSREFQDRKIGLSAGLVGMWGTLGSFLGTVGAGLFLIPNFYLTAIFGVAAAVIFLVGILAVVVFGGRAGRSTIAAVVLFLAGAGWMASSKLPAYEGEIARKSTYYHDIVVRDRPTPKGETARYLQLDTTMEGAQIVETGELVFGYQRFWKLLQLVAPPEVRRSLFIGGGGFGMPQQVSLAFPDSAITIVELDAGVIEIGKEYFRLNEFPEFQLEAKDGRRFLRETDEKYDLIIGDAYSGVHTVPGHLTTLEFFEGVQERMQPDGVYFMNLISAHRGPQSAAFSWLYETLNAVFDSVVVFAVVDPFSPQVQNLILLAANDDLDSRLQAAGRPTDPELLRMLSQRVPDELLPVADGSRIIRDARNPMEWLMAQQIGGGGKPTGRP